MAAYSIVRFRAKLDQEETFKATFIGLDRHFDGCADSCSSRPEIGPIARSGNGKAMSNWRRAGHG